MATEKLKYPREDKCRKCGEHLGWILSELGEVVALGLCDKCTEEGDDHAN